MTRRVHRAVFSAAVAAAGLAAAPAAQAATVDCPYPWISSAYGPINQCVKFTATVAQIGFDGPLASFNPSTGPLTVLSTAEFDRSVTATDGYTGRVIGRVTVQTAYGPTVYATQYNGGSTLGRWGNVNITTKTFYPAIGWTQTVK